MAKKENKYFLDDVDMRNYSQLLGIKWLKKLYKDYMNDANGMSIGVMLDDKEWKSLQRAIAKNNTAKKWQKFSVNVSNMKILD